MALNQDPVAKFDTIPAISGPFSVNSFLLDTITVAETPFEGVWVPTWMAKAGSVEVIGASISTLSIQLYGTNALNPTNSQAITVAGSVVSNDVETLTFSSPNLPAGSVAVNFTATANTTANAAAGLAAAINATPALAALGVVASVVSSVVTVAWPSQPPASGAPAWTNMTNPGPQNTLSIVGSSTGSATFAGVNGSSGTTLGSAITSAGATQLTGIFRYIKARLNTLTGTGAVVSAQYQGVG